MIALESGKASSATYRDVQGFLNLYLMLIYDGLKDWCSSQYSKTLPFCSRTNIKDFMKLFVYF